MRKSCQFVTKEGTVCRVAAVRVVVEPAPLGAGHEVRAYCTLHSKQVESEIHRRTLSWPTAYRL